MSRTELSEPTGPAGGMWLQWRPRGAADHAWPSGCAVTAAPWFQSSKAGVQLAPRLLDLARVAPFRLRQGGVAEVQCLPSVGVPSHLLPLMAAAAMTWSDGDQWWVTLKLPAGPHEFKVVVASSDTGFADWEGGGNRVIEVRAQLPGCSAVLCCAVFCCAVLCCAVLCCALLRCTVLRHAGRPALSVRRTNGSSCSDLIQSACLAGRPAGRPSH